MFGYNSNMEQNNDLTNIPCRRWAKDLVKETQDEIAAHNNNIKPTWDETLRILCESYKTNELQKAA